MSDNGHGYDWSDVRLRPADSLAVEDTWVSPGTGTAYHVGADGRVRGVGWLPLDGTAWTVTAREGRCITARSHAGATLSGEFPAGHRVLVVTEED